MELINITLSGTDTLNKDIEEQEKDIQKKIIPALQYVGSEMQTKLQQHIDKDFYEKYEPTVYPRRKYFPQFGTPLDSKDYMHYGVEGGALAFFYQPSGESSATYADTLNWSDDLKEWLVNMAFKTPGQRIFPRPLMGDKLIEWGQKKHEIGKKEIPARPFWNNFVDDMFNGGIMTAFKKGMAYEVFEEGGQNDFMFDGGESYLESNKTPITQLNYDDIF